MKAEAVSGETPKRELARILAAFERGEIDVLVNAMLLAEGWNSPRATVCMHLAPTASRRVYQQRVGRVTRRHPGKEAGIVVDFVHPATMHDEPIVTLHKLLDRDVYRGGAIVVGPGAPRPRPPAAGRAADRAGDGRPRAAAARLRARAVADRGRVPASRTSSTRGPRSPARASPPTAGAARRRRCTTTPTASCAAGSCSAACSATATRSCASARSPRSPCAATRRASTQAIEIIGDWSREERREGARTLLQALAERRIGRRDQAQAWLWRLAEYSRDVHEEYAVQRWPETKRLLGLLVNSSGPAHGRNARRLVHAARKHDRRLAAALLAAALGAHARGRGGAARRAQPHGAQAVGAGARAGAELPEGQAQAQEAQRPPRCGPPRQGRAGTAAAAKSQSVARRKLAELEVKPTGANGADTAGAPAVEDPEAA